MSTAITAGRNRVWRALTTPAELIRWDDQIIALLDPVPGFPRIGQQARWRYHVGSVEVVALQTIREIRRAELLVSAISLGLFRFEETYGLVEETGAPGRTRLTLKLVTSSSVPLVGGLLDRFSVRRIAAELVDSRLRAIQKWCENHP